MSKSAILDVAAVRRFIEEGIAFESTVRSSAEAIDAGEVPTIAHHGENIVLGIPTVENPNRSLYGSPDGVLAAGGAMVPVEMKSHRKKTRLDEIELCFYWELLEPWRTKAADPLGLLILPDKDGFRMSEVKLTDRRLAQMRGVVEAVRRSRREPPKARICKCIVCSRLEGRRVFEECRARGDLTLVFGIGRTYAAVLEGAGITDLPALRAANANDVVKTLEEAGYHVPEREARAWIHHAAALTDGKPVFFGAQPFDHCAFIALDSEYDTWAEGTPLWLVGVAVVEGPRRVPLHWWADPGEERALLNGLARLVSSHPELPVLTWNGHSADLPALRKACLRWDMEGLFEQMHARHIDLYSYVRSSVRFPVEGLGLKLVAAQLGLMTDPSIADGLDATLAWSRYCEAADMDEAASLRRELIRYNASDVTGLVDLALRVREFTMAAGIDRPT